MNHSKHVPTMAVSLALFWFSSICTAQPGALDLSFNPGMGTGASWYINSVFLQPNGQILIAGNFTSFNNVSQNYVARLNSDGSLDTSFYVGQGPDEPVSIVAEETNGTVLIGGEFNYVNGLPRQNLARLRGDGSLDLTFTNTINGVPTVLIPLANGATLISGGFTTVNGMTMPNLARFNYDGTLDLTFSPAGVSGGDIQAVAVQTNGAMIIGGSFTNVGGQSYQYVARLNSDGSVDTSFLGPRFIGGGTVNGIAIQNNGQPIIFGSFSSVNGYSEVGAARLNADGTLDTSYRAQPGLNGGVGALAVEPNNEILVVGVSGMGFEELNPSGSVDSSFACRVSGTLDAIVIQPDGKILLGGFFTSVDGTNVYGIARLIGIAPGQAQVQFLNINLYAGMFLSGNIGTDYRIEFATNLNSPSLWTPLTNFVLSSNPAFIIDPTLPRSSRFYRAVTLP